MRHTMLRIEDESTRETMLVCEVEVQDDYLLDDDALVVETAEQVIADGGLDFRVVRVGRRGVDVVVAYVLPLES